MNFFQLVCLWVHSALYDCIVNHKKRCNCIGDLSWNVTGFSHASVLLTEYWSPCLIRGIWKECHFCWTIVLQIWVVLLFFILLYVICSYLIFICLFATQCILVQFRLENSILWCAVVSLMKVKYLILSVAMYYGSHYGKYYGLFILAILAQSKHLLKKSQHNFTDHTLFLFQVLAQCVSWANEPGCGQMGQSLKDRSHDHSHFQLSAASHISREHCWFSFHWALVEWGRIRTLFLLSCSFICAC